MELSRHIKEHRVRLGMSQEQLAEAIYVSRQTISNWETDRTYPDVQSLLLLSNLFDVSVDALIKGDVEKMNAVLSAEAKKLNKLSIVMVVSGSRPDLWCKRSHGSNPGIAKVPIAGTSRMLPLRWESVN